MKTTDAFEKVPEYVKTTKKLWDDLSLPGKAGIIAGAIVAVGMGATAVYRMSCHEAGRRVLHEGYTIGMNMVGCNLAGNAVGSFLPREYDPTATVYSY